MPISIDSIAAADIDRENTKRQLADTDGETVRVLEDVISLLEAKGVFSRTELPQSAQDKLANRETLRDSV